MKNFKRFDWMLQVALIAFSVVFTFSNNESFSFIYGYNAYFIVGGWQFISMVIHESAGSFTAKGSRRRYYHNAVYIIVSLMLAGFAIPALLWIYLLMLVAAPVMATWYLYICYDETQHHMERPLAKLK